MALSPKREPVSWSSCCFFPHSERTQTLGLPPIADIPHHKQERRFPIYNWMPVGGSSNITFISYMALTWCICIAGFTTGEELINHTCCWCCSGFLFSKQKQSLYNDSKTLPTKQSHRYKLPEKNTNKTPINET